MYSNCVIWSGADDKAHGMFRGCVAAASVYAYHPCSILLDVYHIYNFHMLFPAA